MTMRCALFIALMLGACDLETPCPSGERLAENHRDGATIRTCVSLADGKATGDYSCTTVAGARVIGRFDRNRKVGTWQYFYNGGELVRSERWNDGALAEVTVHVEEPRAPLRCGKEVIIEEPPKRLELSRGWVVRHGQHVRLYPDSNAVWMSGPYAEQLKDGQWRYFRRDGSLHLEGRYRRGLADGVWIEYDTKGKATRRAQYRNGYLLRGDPLAADAGSVHGMISPDPGELTRAEVKRALEEALH